MDFTDDKAYICQALKGKYKTDATHTILFDTKEQFDVQTKEWHVKSVKYFHTELFEIYYCKTVGGYFCNIAYPTERYLTLKYLE